MLHGKSILVTGGTGSMGQVFVRRALSGERGEPPMDESHKQKPTVAAWREFPSILTAAYTERGAHCPEHNSFTDDCGACYGAHLAQSH